MDNFGINLRKNREHLHFTQEEVAKKLNVTRQVVSNWERGVSYPDIFSLKLLADVFEVTMESLVISNLHLGTVVSSHISEYNGIFFLACLCPNCEKRHEEEFDLKEHSETKLYRFACDCGEGCEFIFDIRPSMILNMDHSYLTVKNS